MKNIRLVCVALGVVLVAVSAVAPVRAQEESPFTLVQRVGEPQLRYLHMFSTSMGKYTIRHDGFGEVYIANRKKNFRIPNAGARVKIEWMYFYEYGGDLLLLYRTGSSGYFVRMDQKTRKIISTKVLNLDFEPPVIREKTVVFSDGSTVAL